MTLRSLASRLLRYVFGVRQKEEPRAGCLSYFLSPHDLESWHDYAVTTNYLGEFRTGLSRRWDWTMTVNYRRGYGVLARPYPYFIPDVLLYGFSDQELYEAMEADRGYILEEASTRGVGLGQEAE